MNNYSEYERAFDWNIADLNHNKITIGEYEAKFRKIIDKIRADAIDEFMDKLPYSALVRMSTLKRRAEEVKEQNNEK